jgi:acetyl-CoA carboxylase, biotin carboxylase subunit
MFDKILIANRGEISRRISQVARGMGIKTVAVYSEADAELPHVKEADEAVLIGPAPSKDSYLKAEAIIEAAKKTGAQAIHPGYGFLSENPEFATAVTQAGITFVGPPPESMLRMKDKSTARQLVMKAGVPVTPGTDSTLPDVPSALAAAEKIGYPVLLKAAGGGGGIGMMVAKDPAELEKAFRACTDRAKAAFGRDAVYLERYFPNPRHIEVQILGDLHGNTLHILDRECSIQRRHQKVVEEGGAPLFMNGRHSALREKAYEAAIRAAKAFGYANAGTVEMLYSDNNIYFMEMNARLQVEHPVTELTTGVDLIGWQLRIAAGEKLTLTQSDIRRKGHALEFRIYAEDPVKFFPSPGKLTAFVPPSGEGVRVDAGYGEGNTVTPNYDPMIAKLIVSGVDRAQAVTRAVKALAEFKVEGIKTNIPLHQRIVKDPAFLSGDLDTRFLENHAKPV